MQIREIIDLLKRESNDVFFNHKIDEATTRDKVLYGNVDQKCNGIVTTCFASIDVIKKTIELGYNFIIVHEALFYNRGDHTDWLQDNSVYQEKEKLLRENSICVWRYHDYIHAGIKIDNEFKDGIFYGLATILGWTDYIVGPNKNKPSLFEIPPMKTRDLISYLTDKLGLKGIKTLGDIDGTCSRLVIPPHIMGDHDSEVISYVEKEKVDVILAMELTDYTVSEYIRDAAYLGHNKCILAIGHFNLEEPGMNYLAGYLKQTLLKELPIKFIASCDSYTLVNKD